MTPRPLSNFLNYVMAFAAIGLIVALTGLVTILVQTWAGVGQ